MNSALRLFLMLAILTGGLSSLQAAYHHEGEEDAPRFLELYPAKAGSKLDHCNLCHQGGSYSPYEGKTITLGSCQWCHHITEYGASSENGPLTLNAFGTDYNSTEESYGTTKRTIGRLREITSENPSLDSDLDSYPNETEIQANTFPGDSFDNPLNVLAPFRIYTRAQLEALGSHTQKLLMNTSRSGDFYAQYTGTPVSTILEDAGILDSAESIEVFAPDGWSNTHPLDWDSGVRNSQYPVYGTYPEATYQYRAEAESWCDYLSPAFNGYNHLDQIVNPNGLKAILAYKREGAFLDAGVLNPDNKLDGEGPFRLVVPQISPGYPDESVKADPQPAEWGYDSNLDHNAGFCSRSATIIKVLPLPEGTTDIDPLEAGWPYVDKAQVIIYGSINGEDSNGNGVLDSEEFRLTETDFDGDNIPDYEDTDTINIRQAYGLGRVRIHCSKGSLKGASTFPESDGRLPVAGRPDRSFPYGAMAFNITGLEEGATVQVRISFPDPVPANAILYKAGASGTLWHPLEFQREADSRIIVLSMTDGDPETDLDGLANGIIVDPAAMTYPPTSATSSSGGGGCSATGYSASSGRKASVTPGTLLPLLLLIMMAVAIRRKSLLC